MIRTSNREAKYYIQKHTPFKGSNTFGKWIYDKYVVFSYGEHYPLFVWDSNANIWLENSSDTTPSTNKQRSQLRPSNTTDKYTTSELKNIIWNK